MAETRTTTDTTTTPEPIKTATFVKQRNAQGEGRVYRLNPPIVHTDWNGENPVEFEHVWVSAVDVMFSGPETYIFGSDENGEVLDWGELEGSYKGGLDHERALVDAGYTVVTA